MNNSPWRASDSGFLLAICSAYKKDMEWLVPSEMNYIGRKDLKNYYDKETGFKGCEKRAIII